MAPNAYTVESDLPAGCVHPYRRRTHLNPCLLRGRQVSEAWPNRRDFERGTLWCADHPVQPRRILPKIPHKLQKPSSSSTSSSLRPRRIYSVINGPASEPTQAGAPHNMLALSPPFNRQGCIQRALRKLCSLMRGVLGRWLSC